MNTQQKSGSSLVGGFFFVGVLALIIMQAGGNKVDALYFFIDGPSGFVVLGPTLGLLAMAFSKQSWASAFRVAIGGGEAHEADAAAMFWGAAGKLAFGSGFLGMIIGCVLILQNLGSPEAIGPSAAVAIISIFYGLLAWVICKALSYKANMLGE